MTALEMTSWIETKKLRYIDYARLYIRYLLQVL